MNLYNKVKSLFINAYALAIQNKNYYKNIQRILRQRKYFNLLNL